MIGATVEEAQERMSHREYLTRLAWLDAQWNAPDRTDHYLMNIACLILATHGVKSSMAEQKIPFTQAKPKRQLTPEQQKAQAVAMAKAKWLGFLKGTKHG